jgi:hypothetical protein
MYLKISNKGQLNRHAIRLVGYSAKTMKRADPGIFGQFGTGTVYAAVTAVRLGLDVCITSTDSQGRYLLRFEVEETDMGDGLKAKEIYLNYWGLDGEGNAVSIWRIPWNQDIAAYRDFDEPIGDDDSRVFKLLREFICNAHDEDLEFSIHHVDGLEFAPEGMAEVYIENTAEMDAVFRNLERYFKFMSPALKKCDVPGIGSVYPKSQDGLIRKFVQGVLVSCNKLLYIGKPLFDYSLNNKGLVSEDRRIKNPQDYDRELGRLLVGIEDPRLVKLILEHAEKEVNAPESNALYTVSEMTDSARAVWLKVLCEIYGSEKICIATGNPQQDGDARQLYGYEVIRASSDVEIFLNKALGIPKSKEIVDYRYKIKLLPFSGFDSTSQQNFLTAYSIVMTQFPEIALIPFRFFYADTKKLPENLYAYAEFNNGEQGTILMRAISETELPDLHILVEMILHESTHCKTRAGDYDRKFVDMVEKRCLLLLARMSGLKNGFDGKPLPPKGIPNLLKPILPDPPPDALVGIK